MLLDGRLTGELVVSLKSAYAQRVAFGMTAPEKDNKRWHVQLRCESILGNRVMLACSNRAILAAPAVPRVRETRSIAILWK